MSITNKINQLLIVSITPYFLEKGFLWYGENLDEVLKAQKTQSFFQDNILFLKKGQDYKLNDVLRKLDEMGYEKVFTLSDPGEFSQRGGILDIFPINTAHAIRLDFLGNTIDSIQELPLKVESEEKSKNVLKKRLKSQKLFSQLKGLKPGDYLVHLDHGIGKFIGKEKLTIDNQLKEYYVLAYDKEDKLFVPVGLERKLSQYVGFHDPLVSRLGSALWQKTKRKIKENVEKMAKELLELYAKKETSERPVYIEDRELESQFEANFPYEYTPDQLQAIEDIQNDLAKTKPMDRIVCGDVGFGKTEIAMRASLLAVANNRQTALICPTTILADQHFNNFKKRFAKFPVTVALLSRLQSGKEKQKIVSDLKEGKIDIVIGTHRLLSKDVFSAEGGSASGGKNLQLLIIDDEQRFGVKQKEKLRQLKSSLDVLSLSATPIPRTIYLAMSSFKGISLMQTPPKGRQAITTKVLPYQEKNVKKIIAAELKRKGQVYFLHNRVATIEHTAEKLKKLCQSLPAGRQAKIGIIHGQMTEQKLIKVMDDFQNEKINVLVATTIIENGLDLPNVNTIIVEDATRLGLSQAHQIRGRVGRSDKKGFAYFFYPVRSKTPKASADAFSHRTSNWASNRKHLPPLAQERLKTLEDQQELGSGYQIALRDLELRGAGNILGREQSGAINRIGLNLYSQMLSEAVEKLKG